MSDLILTGKRRQREAAGNKPVQRKRAARELLGMRADGNDLIIETDRGKKRITGGMLSPLGDAFSTGVNSERSRYKKAMSLAKRFTGKQRKIIIAMAEGSVPYITIETLAVKMMNGGAMTDEDLQAAKLAGMSVEEFKKYSNTKGEK